MIIDLKPRMEPTTQEGIARVFIPYVDANGMRLFNKREAPVDLARTFVDGDISLQMFLRRIR